MPSRSTEPLQEPTTEPAPPSSVSPDDDDASSGPDVATPSGPRSTGRAKIAALRRTAREGVITAGGLVHQLLTREGTPERAEELWMPDADDVEAIADPLAGLASRRLPSGVENPDVTDLARLAIALLGYALKQKFKLDGIQRYYAHQAGPESEGSEPTPDEAWADTVGPQPQPTT